MIESKHTPGPWFVRENIDGIYAETMSVVATTDGEVCGPRQIRKQAKGCVEANARLIAAAPELLAALQECIAEADDYEARTGRKLIGDWPGNARLAIAKAKGDTNG